MQKLVDGILVDLTEAEIAAKQALDAAWEAKAAERANKQADQLRQAAYEKEADPLFFKYQRGEATEQEWLNKIVEIKARYPKAGE